MTSWAQWTTNHNAARNSNLTHVIHDVTRMRKTLPPQKKVEDSTKKSGGKVETSTKKEVEKTIPYYWPWTEFIHGHVWSFNQSQTETRTNVWILLLRRLCFDPEIVGSRPGAGKQFYFILFIFFFMHISSVCTWCALLKKYLTVLFFYFFFFTFFQQSTPCAKVVNGL